MSKTVYSTSPTSGRISLFSTTNKCNLGCTDVLYNLLILAIENEAKPFCIDLFSFLSNILPPMQTNGATLAIFIDNVYLTPPQRRLFHNYCSNTVSLFCVLTIKHGEHLEIYLMVIRNCFPLFRIHFLLALNASQTESNF